jgi:glucose-1-phosphate adenylyltransferase
VPDFSDLSQSVAVVLAGGRGTRLFELTQRESKPALPFARYHRIVDFTMASLARSGVGTVLAATQYCPATLSAHLGENWAGAFGSMLLRNGNVVADGGYRGTADVLRRNAAELDRLGVKDLLIAAADHIYAMDYRPLLQAHRDHGAQITLAAMPVPRDEASRFGVITEGDGGRIANFAEKPAQPAAMPDDAAKALVSMGIYIVDWPWLRERLADPSPMDFGHDIVPLAVERGEAAVWRWSGYWRDVGTLDGLRESWIDFEATNPPCPRPLVPGSLLRASDHGAARDRFQARITLGGLRLMSPLIGNTDPGRWAALDRSVLMQGAQVNPGVRLSNVIVAPGTIIPDGLRIGEDRAEDQRWFRVSGDTVLVTSAMLARRAAERSRAVPTFHCDPKVAG